MNAKQRRKTRRFMLRMFIRFINILAEWENNQRLKKDQIIDELQRLVKESKELKK